MEKQFKLWNTMCSYSTAQNQKHTTQLKSHKRLQHNSPQKNNSYAAAPHKPLTLQTNISNFRKSAIIKTKNTNTVS